MKKYLLAIVCLTCLLISSCEKDSIEFDSPFELGVNESIILSGGLSITLESVNDSRCPINAFCISAGNARVKLRMSDNSGAETFTELCLGFCDTRNNTEDSEIIRLNNVSYIVVLKTVSPYPEVGKNPDKKVLLIIRKE
ncbi:MAG: hypothetical protein WC220_01600 [Pedobacter sp.]